MFASLPTVKLLSVSPLQTVCTLWKEITVHNEHLRFRDLPSFQLLEGRVSIINYLGFLGTGDVSVLPCISQNSPEKQKQWAGGREREREIMRDRPTCVWRPRNPISTLCKLETQGG